MGKKLTNEEYLERVSKINPNIEVLETYVNVRTKLLYRCTMCGYEWRSDPRHLFLAGACPICNGYKYTKEKYIGLLKDRNPNIVLLDKYVDSRTSVPHKCLMCGYEWNTVPSRVLGGAGCPACTGNTHKTQEEYIEDVKRINPKIDVIGVYKNAHTKITHRCKECGYEWNVMPNGVLNGHGCPKCGGSLKLTHQQYMDRLHNVNNNIEVVGIYVNMSTKILHRCLIDGCEWYERPETLLKGCGCPKCAGSYRRTQEDYSEDLKKLNPNVVVIGEFVNVHERILHKCLIHDYIWETSPELVLQGCGCPKCRSEKISSKRSYTTQEYIKRLANSNPEICAIEEYKGVYTPILHQCLKCGHQWSARPTYLLQGYGCPRCNESVGERKVRQWLESKNVEFVEQYRFDDCRDIKPLPFDFYLPEYNSCVEFDGQQHYEPKFGDASFKATTIHDSMKNKYCEENGIRLLRIPYYKNIGTELDNFLFN